MGRIHRLADLSKAFGKASLEARRQLVEELTTEVRLEPDETELVIRPEYRETIAGTANGNFALAFPGQEPDPRGLYTPGRPQAETHEAGPVGCAGLEPATLRM